MKIHKPLIIIGTAAILCSCSSKQERQAERALKVQEANAIVSKISKISPVIVSYFGISEPNSAGGVDVTIRYQNISGEVLKYVRFDFEGYNAVGDLQKSSVGDTITQTGKDTGPIKPLNDIVELTERVASYDVDVPGGTFENMWYNSTVNCAILTSIRVEKMNGETIIVDEKNELRNIFANNSHTFRNTHDDSFFKNNTLSRQNDCSYENQIGQL